MAGSTEPPSFKLGRYDEDYRYLDDPARGREGDDAFKNIHLGDVARLSIGGEWRERFDVHDAPHFGLGAAADSYILQRFLLHADLHVAERVRAFVQIGRADAVGKKGALSPSDADRGDVQNAFVDIAAGDGRRIALRLGRQELLLNTAQRFVSVREGPNVRQSFDGAILRWDGSGLSALAFANRPVNARPGAFDDRSDRSQRFFGGAMTRSWPHQSLQVYALGIDRGNVTVAAAAGDERSRSLGARWAGAEGAFDHDLEAIGQWGSFADRPIRAWAVGAIGGYTVAGAWKPRLGLEFDAGSGDKDRLDGRHGTFDPMFPKGAYFNESSSTSWSNLLLARASFTVQPRADVSLGLSAGRRWRQTAGDAVYMQPSIALPTTLTNRARRVGDVVQFDASWHATRYLTFTAQALHQSAGPAIRQAGGHAIDFLMLVAQARF